MQPPVFLADRAALESDVVVLSGAEGRHAATVRRLRPGERADVADGAGLVAECVVAGHGAGGLELTVRARREVPPGRTPRSPSSRPSRRATAASWPSRR